MEMQDTYVRLDRSIASLLDIIDKKVGLQNVVFFITSTGYTDTESPDLGLYRVPTGEFHLNRCAALLNMYLMATYGQGQYVEAYYDQRKTTESGGYTGKSRRISDPVQRSE